MKESLNHIVLICATTLTSDDSETQAACGMIINGCSTGSPDSEKLGIFDRQFHVGLTYECPLILSEVKETFHCYLLRHCDFDLI